MRPWFIRIDYGTIWFRLNRNEKRFIFDNNFLVFAFQMYDLMVDFDQWFFALSSSDDCFFADGGEIFELIILNNVRFVEES